MSLIDKLSQTEKTAIMRYINTYADVPSKSNIETLLRFWDVGKSSYLSQLFKDGFVLKKDIMYEKPEEFVVSELSHALYCHRFFERIYDVPNYDIEVHRLVNYYTLAENKYMGESFEFNLGEKVIKVQRGCKPMRILGKIAQAYGFEKEFEDFRLRHSMVLNQKKIKGKLCISIHPLDYMTMSDNTSNWTSCMSWMDCGEYRRGTVEMMNSPMVVVAYLEGSNPFHIFADDGFEWSNKKWRELFIVHPNIITGVKGYPYHISELEKEVCNWLKDLATENLGWNYFDTLVNYGVDCSEGHIYFFDNIFNIVFETDDMYNDFGSCRHIGYISPKTSEQMEINYSGPAVCLCCGKEKAWFDTEGDLACEKCNQPIYCYDCGCRLTENEAINIRGNIYCEYCSDKIEILECPLTHEIFYPDFDPYIYLHLAKKNENNEIICLYDYCAIIKDDVNLHDYPQYFKETAEINYNGSYVLIEDCTKEGLIELFGYYGVA